MVTRDPSAEHAPSPVVTWAAIGLLLLYATLAWLSRLPGVSYSNDDAVYVWLGRSLLDGTYRDLYLWQSPLHLQYPPLWPAILAVASLVSGENTEVMLGLTVLLVTAGLAFLFDAARRVLSPSVALTALALSAVNVFLIRYGGRLMAEAAFFFFMSLTLWAASHRNPSGRRMAVAGAAAIGCALTRSIGVTIIFALALHWALERRWRVLFLFCVATAVTVLPWLTWSLFGPRQVIGRSYMGDLAAVDPQWAASRGHPAWMGFFFGAARRGARYVGDLSQAIGFPRLRNTPVDNVAWLLLAAIGGSIGLTLLWRRWRVCALFIGVYGGMLLSWSWADRRFLVPVTPFVVVGFAAAAAWIGERLARSKPGLRSMPTVLTVGLLVLLAPRTIQQTQPVVRSGLACDRKSPTTSPDCYSDEQRAFFAAADFARKNLPDSAILLVDREAAFSFHSDRKVAHSSEVIRQRGKTPLLDALKARRITHILAARLTVTDTWYLPQALLPHCRRFAVTASFEPSTHIFELLSEPSDTNACQALEALDKIKPHQPRRTFTDDPP